MALSLETTQGVLSAHAPRPRASSASAHFYETLAAGASGTFDPNAQPPVPTTLIQLSFAGEDGANTMFDVLAAAYDAEPSLRAALAAYTRTL